MVGRRRVLLDLTHRDLRLLRLLRRAAAPARDTSDSKRYFHVELYYYVDLFKFWDLEM